MEHKNRQGRMVEGCKAAESGETFCVGHKATISDNNLALAPLLFLCYLDELEMFHLCDVEL